MITGLDHIAIIVSAEKCLSFYEQLGFRETKRIQRNYDEVIFMRKSEITLEIFVDKNHPKHIKNPEAMGLRHIALSVNDLRNTIEELKNKGIKAEPVRQDWFGRNLTFIYDPDEQPIELIENIND